MRKTILLAVIACILGIVLLAALAFYIPNGLGRTDGGGQSEMFTGFQISTESAAKPSPSAKESESRSDGAGSSPGHMDTETGSTEFLPHTTLSSGSVRPQEETGDSSEETGRFSPLPARIKVHQVIWVGDSRTLGMQNALHKAGRTDDDLFVGQVGEGVRWFREQGMSELSDVIDQYPSLPVVMNFGVNDPQLIDEYVVAYWDVIREHPDTRFYILSVNPLDEEFLIEDGQVNESVFDDINSLNVARMNVKLKKEFGSRYIDSASYLKADGYETVDGLHFTTQTYLKIHDYVVNCL